MIYPTLWRGSVAPSLWDDVASARREVDRVFDRFFAPGATSPALQTWAPVVDVRETNDEIMLTAELPGIAPEDVDVTVEGGTLMISGEKKEERKEGKGDGAYHLFERRYGRFERSFTLPSSVRADQVKARFENGLLTVTLPKAEEAKPKRIQVQVTNGGTRR